MFEPVHKGGHVASRFARRSTVPFMHAHIVTQAFFHFRYVRRGEYKLDKTKTNSGSVVYLNILYVVKQNPIILVVPQTAYCIMNPSPIQSLVNSTRGREQGGNKLSND